MSSGPDTVTQTTTSEPSPLLVPSIRTAANSALSQFTGSPSAAPFPSGPPGFPAFPGVAGGLGGYGQFIGGLGGLNTPGTPIGDSPSVYDTLRERGVEGSPVIDDATDLTRSVLQGDFLTPDSNPYLESTFNRAADLTQTRLASEFAGAGRDLDASLPARSEELQTLASNIFGQNFARERGLQNAAVSQALPLGTNDFTDINAQIDAEDLPLDTLINRIQGLAPAAGGTAISSQPLQRSPLSGALGGAALGAAIPGIGPLIGGIGGGLLGLFG